MKNIHSKLKIGFYLLMVTTECVILFKGGTYRTRVAHRGHEGWTLKLINSKTKRSIKKIIAEMKSTGKSLSK